MKARLRTNTSLVTFEINNETHHCLPVLGWRDYFVTTMGKVISTKGPEPTVLADRLNNNGYYYVILSDGKRQKQFGVHRLVAQAFLECSLKDQWNAERSQVNHIDCNKINNKVANLEWCSSSENLAHYRLMKSLGFEQDAQTVQQGTATCA